MSIYNVHQYKFNSECYHDSTTDSIPATTAAAVDLVDFYKEQARIRQVFDSNERINAEFRNTVTNHDSYPERYVGSAYYDEDLSILWKYKCVENSIFEFNCIHGKDCVKINDCTCTSIEVCKLHDQFRDAQNREVNRNSYHNASRREENKDKTQEELEELFPQQHSGRVSNHSTTKKRDKRYDSFENYTEAFFKQ